MGDIPTLPPRIKAVIHKTAQIERVPVRLILSRDRAFQHCRARHAAWRNIRDLEGAPSYRLIASWFGVTASAVCEAVNKTCAEVNFRSCDKPSVGATVQA